MLRIFNLKKSIIQKIKTLLKETKRKSSSNDELFYLSKIYKFNYFYLKQSILF